MEKSVLEHLWGDNGVKWIWIISYVVETDKNSLKRVRKIEK